MSPQPKEAVPGWVDVLGEHAGNPPVPRSTGECIIEQDGTEWLVSTNEGRIKAQFEQWIRASAEKVISDMERNGEHQNARKYQAIYLSARAAGHYNWNGDVCREALSDFPGVLKFLFLLLRRCHPKVTMQDVVRLFQTEQRQVAAAVNWAQGNLLAPEAKPGPKKSKTEDGEDEQTLDDESANGEA